MNEEYHRQVTTEALADHLNAADLEIVIQANIGQDTVWNWLTTPERHYDGRRFTQAEAYIAQERARAVSAFQRGDRIQALQALGRLLHTRQDFYSHSNWMQRCAEEAGSAAQSADNPIICLDPQADTTLFAARAPFLIHALYLIPVMGALIKRVYLPADYHEAMHLDNPSRGPLFAPSLLAARLHTRLEWETVQRQV